MPFSNRTSLSLTPAKSSIRTLSNTTASSRATCFPFAVGVITEDLRPRRLTSRFTRRLASRRSINRVTMPLSLARSTGRCEGLLLRPSTQRIRTLASCAVIPKPASRRWSDVCSTMQVWNSRDNSKSRCQSRHYNGADEPAPDMGTKIPAVSWVCSICEHLPIFQASSVSPFLGASGRILLPIGAMAFHGHASDLSAWARRS